MGRGAEDFDLDGFGADVAYTLDGSDLGELEVETFSAKSVRVTIHGLSVHPGRGEGEARERRQARLASSSHRSRQDRLSPETTEGPRGVRPSAAASPATRRRRSSTSSSATTTTHLLEEHTELLRSLAARLAELEPRAHVDIEVRDIYRNMGRVIERTRASWRRHSRRSGARASSRGSTITRGGTDGAVLSAQGLPTPNLFTGGQEYHSVREWASVQDMAAAAATIVELAGVWAERDS